MTARPSAGRLRLSFDFQRAPLSVLLGALIAGDLALASPSIVSDDCPAGATKFARSQPCPGALCTDDCSITEPVSYTVSVAAPKQVTAISVEVNGTPVPNAAITFVPPLPATSTVISFNKTFPVGCPTGVDEQTLIEFPIVVTATSNEAAGNVSHDTCTAKMTCHKCNLDGGKTATQSSGNSSVQPSPVDQIAGVQFNVLNLSADEELIDLVLGSFQGWAVFPPVPSQVTLPPGGAVDLYFDVTVPAGTAAGTIETLTLFAGFPGEPSSSSTASATISVQCELTAEVNDTVRLSKLSLTETIIEWTDSPGGFNVYRGFRNPLGPWSYNHSCFENAPDGNLALDSQMPLLGRTFYYLVTRKSVCGESSPGQNSFGVDRPNPNPCGVSGVYYRDDTDAGDDPFAAGCHWRYFDSLCTTPTFFMADRCEPGDNPDLLSEWTDQSCHSPANDLKVYHCNDACVAAHFGSGRCVVVPNACDGGTRPSAKCECL